MSFVVPCYKLAHMLPQCVGSILSQTFKDFEVLIMDNCSPDETGAVTASFQDARVKHVRNEVNLGHVRNFNKGITLARGKYVWLVSADDSLRSPHVLERYVDVMERNPEVGYVFCRAVELQDDNEGGIVRWADCGEEDRIWDGPAFLTRLIENNRIVMSAGMVRKTCFDQVSLFPQDLPYACDWYLWSVFALHHRVAYLSEPMVYWRVHEESLTASFNRKDGRICLDDELSVLWRVGREAELEGRSSLWEASKAAIARRAVSALRAEDKNPGAGMSQADLEGLLQSRVQDRKAERQLLARICEELADEHYRDREYSLAAAAYRRAIRFRPRSLRSWAKYTLLSMGTVGRAVRRLVTGPPPGSAEKRSILFVINTSAYGGAERHLIELMRRLDDAGVRRSILCLGPDFYTARLGNIASIRCQRQPASLWGWVRTLRNARPDVVVFVYGWLWSFPWFLPVAAALAGIPRRFAIQHLFASPLPPADPRRPIRNVVRRLFGGWSSTLLAMRISAAFCNKIICVSSAVRDSLVSGYRFPANRTITIHNGVAVSDFSPSPGDGLAVRSQLGLSPQDFVLLCAARLSKVKGIGILLLALYKLVRGGTAVKCIIAGDGPLKDDLAARVRALELTEHVFFVGFQEDIKPYLQAADAFVLTSHKEGLPLSILEAMASGLPCVVTNVGGNAEAVVHGVTGMVVAPGSVSEVAQAISYLATHPREREQMSRMTRARVSEAFDINSRMAEIKRVMLS